MESMLLDWARWIVRLATRGRRFRRISTRDNGDAANAKLEPGLSTGSEVPKDHP